MAELPQTQVSLSLSLSLSDMYIWFNLVGVVSVDCRKAKTTITIKRRNLIKLNLGEEDQNNNVKLEDYGVIDPVPSTTTSIRPGPIQHGTPLLPYIPEPSPPPTQPDQVDFP
ncbi:hypothetical protein ACP275_14G273600 [Erythranthe tilingii]